MDPQLVNELLEKPDVYWRTMSLEELDAINVQTNEIPECETLETQARRHQLRRKLSNMWRDRSFAEIAYGLEGPEEGSNVVSLR